MAINICHNITTVQGTNGVTYEGNSPDELALIEATQAIGIQLTYRDREKLVISIRDLPEAEQYTILQVFPFTSVRKRMGIIVRKDASNQILFLLKGTDFDCCCKRWGGGGGHRLFHALGRPTSMKCWS